MNNDKKIAARKETVEKTRSPLGIRIAKYVTAFAVVLVLFWLTQKMLRISKKDIRKFLQIHTIILKKA